MITDIWSNYKCKHCYMWACDNKYDDLSLINHNERCKDCEYASRCCGVCRAMALNANREDIMGIDANACLLLRGGYIERIDAAVKSAAPNAKRR